MKINLRVEFNNDTSEEVVCSAIDLIKFEEHFNLSIARLDKEMKLTHLLYLAHSSLFRQGKTKLAFEDWVESVAVIAASDSDPK